MKLYLSMMASDSYTPVHSVGKERLSIHATLDEAKEQRVNPKYGVDCHVILELDTDTMTVKEVISGW